MTVTGGEPLAQPACLDLLTALLDLGYTVSLETSGALDVSAVDPRAIKVMDLKTPSSGELSRNLYTKISSTLAKKTKLNLSLAMMKIMFGQSRYCLNIN